MCKGKIANGCYPRRHLGHRHKVEPVRLSKNFDSIKSAYIFCTGGGDSVDEILQGKWENWMDHTRLSNQALADDNKTGRVS
jgi:hypothetical protein